MKRKTYPSDLTLEQYKLLKSLLVTTQRGRPRKHQLRHILNAIFYLARTGCQWRQLPKHFPPWKTVYDYFWRLRKNGKWQQINDILRDRAREKLGRARSPSGGRRGFPIGENRSKRGQQGWDAGKKIKGRKRHIVVDTLGHLMSLRVHSAGIQDRRGARSPIALLLRRFERLKVIWADGAYAGALVEWVKDYMALDLQIVEREKGVKGFKVLPRRWIVERTFGWWTFWRRLSKDYEHNPRNSEGMIYLASIALMINRLV